jgi:hypothetical protein
MLHVMWNPLDLRVFFRSKSFLQSPVVQMLWLHMKKIYDTTYNVWILVCVIAVLDCGSKTNLDVGVQDSGIGLRDAELDAGVDAHQDAQIDSDIDSEDSDINVDPANIVGTWQYSTTSNCGNNSSGLGTVVFSWIAGIRYWEEGNVLWPQQTSAIYWGGETMFDPFDMTLRGTLDNSLGDSVDSVWRLDDSRPTVIEASWSQNNGCHGHGVATR